jgi:hypothetical protein
VRNEIRRSSPEFIQNEAILVPETVSSQRTASRLGCVVATTTGVQAAGVASELYCVGKLPRAGVTAGGVNHAPDLFPRLDTSATGAERSVLGTSRPRGAPPYWIAEGYGVN